MGVYEGPETTWKDMEDAIKILQESCFGIINKTILIAETMEGNFLYKSPILRAIIELIDLDGGDTQFLELGGGDFYSMVGQGKFTIGQINKSRVRLVMARVNEVNDVLASGIISW